jgi:Ni/Co efflux regulator RcnB
MEDFMKKMLLGAVIAAVSMTPMAASPSMAQAQRTVTKVKVKPNGRTVVKKRVVRASQQQNRRWARGQRFDRRYASNYQEIGNWQQYRGRRLYAPPRGYHWVRSGNDAVLVAVTGGLIGAVLAGAFN